MRDKNQYNRKGKAQGYWEHYYSDRHLMYKCYYVNGVDYGYGEGYRLGGKLGYKRYYAR